MLKHGAESGHTDELASPLDFVFLRSSMPRPAIQEFLVHPEWFFTQIDGKRVGPFTPQQLTYMACGGELTPDGAHRGKGWDQAATAQSFEMLAARPKRHQ
jgi:hypothetical protein